MAVHALLAGVADWLLRKAVSYDLGAPLPSAPPLLSRYTHGDCDWFAGICSVPDRVTWLTTEPIVLRVAVEAGGPAPTADGKPKRLCRRIQLGGTCRLRGDRVERAPRRQ